MNIHGNFTRAEGAIALADALKVNAVLTNLDISWNKFCGLDQSGMGTYNASGIKALAEALKVNAVLTNLNIRGNNIGVEGAAAIADGLKVNAVLTFLKCVAKSSSKCEVFAL